MGPEVLQYMSTVEIISLAHEAFEVLLPKESELRITVSSGGDSGKCLQFHVHGHDNATILREAIPARYSGLDTIVIYTYDNSEK